MAGLHFHLKISETEKEKKMQLMSPVNTLGFTAFSSLSQCFNWKILSWGNFKLLYRFFPLFCRQCTSWGSCLTLHTEKINFLKKLTF